MLELKTPQTLPFRVTSSTDFSPRFSPLDSGQSTNSLYLSIPRKLKDSTEKDIGWEKPFQLITTHLITIIIVIVPFSTYLTLLSNTWRAWRWGPNPKSFTLMAKPGQSFLIAYYQYVLLFFHLWSSYNFNLFYKVIVICLWWDWKLRDGFFLFWDWLYQSDNMNAVMLQKKKKIDRKEIIRFYWLTNYMNQDDWVIYLYGRASTSDECVRSEVFLWV